MRKGDRPTTLIVIALTMGLAVLVGVAVPLGSGNRLGGAQMAWTPPKPTLTATSLPPATATAPPEIGPI